MPCVIVVFPDNTYFSYLIADERSMVGNNDFGMSFIFKQCMKNAQNYGKDMLLFFLVTICPSSSM